MILKRGISVKTVQNCIRIAMIALSGLACVPPSSELVTECKVASSQSSLFMGKWPTHPIPLAVEVNDFTDSEIVELQKAIQKWNEFYQASRGFKLFLVGTDTGLNTLGLVSSSGVRLTKSTVCTRPITTPSGFTNAIRIYKNRNIWEYGSQVMALTSYCPLQKPEAQFREFYAAVMEINYKDYFVSGKRKPDLQSIVIHELGHVLGLDHSCKGSSDCSSASNEIRTAVMYPSLGFNGNNGNIKRELGTNDQERANCLY
jgi:hypothetical protein